MNTTRFCFASIMIMILALFPMQLLADEEDVELTCERVKNNGEGNEFPRSPIQPPTATIDDHTFHITCAHPDYVLQLVDMDDNTVVYQSAMPSAISTATLPSVFTGQYRIQLIWGMWCFYGFVEL